MVKIGSNEWASAREHLGAYECYSMPYTMAKCVLSIEIFLFWILQITCILLAFEMWEFLMENPLFILM
jgi:hypothetical protein